MKNWEEDQDSEYCTAREDLADAIHVCDKLSIKLHQANFSAEYWDNVFEHFIHEYEVGRTPNPDILCNREIKFKVFLEYAQLLGADFIATGHYARLRKHNGKTELLKARDRGKDQTYFLQAVGEAEFAKSIFPLGDMHKKEVRELARHIGLTVHNKKDSTGICFIGERRFKDFLSNYMTGKEGNIRSADGKLVGRHHGLMFYTLGQRRGLGIGGIKDEPEAAWYVIGKDSVMNELRVAQGNNNPLLFSASLTCSEIHWIDGKGPDLPTSCNAKVRYRQKDQACRIVKEFAGYRVTFEEAQRAVTPGQSVCFYVGDICLGGGVIQSTTPASNESD